MEKALQKLPQSEMAKSLNQTVLSVLSQDQLMGFEKSYLIANAVGELKRLLTPEYMKPIMELQGNKLGFKTDKDIAQGGGKGPGYTEEIVKNCLIEAVLFGVQPFGNQFNIIANNCYITKEGFGHLLSKYAGLSYQITPQLPRIKDGSAACVMDIEWTLEGVKQTKKIDFAIKVNSYMGADAVIGKATRKARCWLYNTITGSEIPEGDTQDVDGIVTDSKLNITLEDIMLLFDMKKETLTTEEAENAQRIIENKEQASYSKLFKFLQSK